MDHATVDDDLHLADRRLWLPRGRCIYENARQRDLSALRAQVARDQTGLGPYLAMLWPSGIALADAITLQPTLVRGQRRRGGGSILPPPFRDRREEGSG